jgi:hypothetical protein
MNCIKPKNFSHGREIIDIFIETGGEKFFTMRYFKH